MTVDRMREELIKAYDGPAWRLRVEGMADRQVIAIYKNMQRRPRRKKPKLKEDGVQMNIWDLLND